MEPSPPAAVLHERPGSSIDPASVAVLLGVVPGSAVRPLEPVFGRASLALVGTLGLALSVAAVVVASRLLAAGRRRWAVMPIVVVAGIGLWLGGLWTILGVLRMTLTSSLLPLVFGTVP